MNKEQSICIIPARSGSKGLRNKNILELGDYPLMAWPIKAALKSECFAEIFVSTDSKEYMTIALNYGASCPFLRPDFLSSDTASSIDVIENVLEYFSSQQNRNFANICLLEPTSPLTSSQDIKNAFHMLEVNPSAESIVGIGTHGSVALEFLNYLDKENFIRPILQKDDSRHIRRQDIADRIYFYDGSIYLSSTKSLLTHRSFYHEKTLGMVFPQIKNIEIDTQEDFIILEAIIKNRSISPS